MITLLLQTSVDELVRRKLEAKKNYNDSRGKANKKQVRRQEEEEEEEKQEQEEDEHGEKEESEEEEGGKKKTDRNQR